MGRAARDQADKLWAQLDTAQRWELGDQLVLGTFSWDEWFQESRLPGTLTEINRLRMLWEQTA